MKRTLMITLTAMALSAALVACGTMENGGGPQAAQAQKKRLVMQVSDDDPKTWNQTLNVARNIQQSYGKDKVDVEIVAFGHGIGMLKFDAPIADRVTQAVQSGVRVVACENTMRGRKLTKADMNASVGYVPAGIREIMDRQAEGYAYVRP